MMISTNHHQPPPPHTVPRRQSSGGARLVGLFLMMMLGPAYSMTYQKPLLIEDLESLFGPDGCIEGSLTMTPTAPVVIQTMQDNHVSSSDIDGKGSMQGICDDRISSSDPAALMACKEKTPMCLVNELARYNKIEHQYRLTSEEGPPHKKKFTVTLKLGKEEYSAEGPSIKKAQHSAASLALKATGYKRPPPKSSRNPRQGKGNITPTVELNALAMKRGEPTTYTLVEMPQYSYATTFPYHRPMYSQGDQNTDSQKRYYCGKAAFKVKVRVGEKEFSGEGVSAQAARHDAAAKALQTLRSLPIDTTTATSQTIYDGGAIDADSGSELKSPISLVHEIALKRNLPVVFEVISEKGPPHMRTFVTRCTVGDKFQTSGEGNGKKVSKKRAAERMLEELKTLPPTTTVTVGGGTLARTRRKTNPNKKKSRNLIKDTVQISNSQDTKYEDGVEEINPISRLIQIQQAKKEKEPVYTLRDERGLPRRREFVMEVTVGEHSFVGTGPNKKMAKRNAAEGLLQALGYSSPTVNRQGHPLPSHTNKVRFADDKTNSAGGSMGGVSGRQLVPGLILMNDKASTNGNSHTQHKHSGVNLKATAAIAKEYLNEGSEGGRLKSGTTVRPTEQLRYLAQVLNFQVQFSDFPKGNHSEYLSLVTLGTDPPQVCHGAGSTTELSQDQAALSALRSLSEMGLDSIAPVKKEQQPTLTQTPNPDGMYIGIGSTMPKDDNNYVNGK